MLLHSMTCCCRVQLAVTGYNFVSHSLYHRVHRCTTVTLNHIQNTHCMNIGKTSTACIAHAMPGTVAQITSADFYLQGLLSCALRLPLWQCVCVLVGAASCQLPRLAAMTSGANVYVQRDACLILSCNKSVYIVLYIEEDNSRDWSSVDALK